MRLITSLLLIFLIALGCSTANKTSAPPATEFMPPQMANWPINNQLFGEKDFGSIDLFLSRVAKENPGLPTTWWADYRRAQLWSKKDKNVACENYSRLAGETRFPLRRLAYLHAHEVCPKNNQILARLEPFQLESFEPWVINSAIDIAITKAKAKNNRSELVEYNLKKSKLNVRKEEKVAYALEALKYAKRLKDKNKIVELQSRIYNLSPSLIPHPQPKDYLAVALDYRYLRNFDAALKYFNKIISSKKLEIGDKLQALKGIRTTFKIQQKRPESIVATENLTKFVEKYYKKSNKTAADAKLYVDSNLLLARTYWTENEVKKARKVLDKIQKNIVNKTSLAELFWIRGRMEEEVQNFSGSISWFQKALSETVDSQSFRDKINWYLAWNYRKTKDYPNAIKILKDIKEHSENGLERSRVMFWLARILNDSGEKDDAKDIYKNLIKEDPLGYYSLIAHREMDEPFETKIFKSSDKSASYKKDDSHLPHSLLTQIDLNYFNWLVATKESQIAGDYLETVAARLRKDKNTEDETWSALFYLYAKTENYISLFNQLNSLKPGVRKAIISENTEIIFPNPFFETVSQAANRFGISPEFIYSIMRQESSFNPQARSQMDAFGLMQLLPEVAKKSADANSITMNGEEDLYLPYVNIPIGSAYLRELWDKYNGELVLAVASYNASEPAIISWLKTRYRGDTLEFIEDIPYDETRDYVKLVLRNLISYQIINTKTDSSSFPEWTLKISERDTASPKGKKN